MSATVKPKIGFPQNGVDNYFRFHLIFEFCVLEFIENDINIDRLCGRLFEILGVKV